MQLHDTIVAISSPPGPAARGIVRLSGPDSHRLAGIFFEALHFQKPLQAFPIVIEGRIRLELGSLPASAWMFAAPKSYTRQDMAELHLLGSPGVMGLLVEALIAAGARRAEAGEFTARAYLNGALDLAQVHGVAALIAAQSEGQRRAAARLLEGSLSKTAYAAREELADLLSLVEGALDFADEPIDFITPVDLRARLGSLAATLQETLDVCMRTERWGRMPHVLLAGLPNAGKSSLLNRLSGSDRAIATPVAGTTRDTLTTTLYIKDRGECVLIDSAGISERPIQAIGPSESSAEAEGGPPKAEHPDAFAIHPDTVHFVERQALSATHTAAADADLILWILDAAATPDSWPAQNETLKHLWHSVRGNPRDGRPTGLIVVLNKADVATEDNLTRWSAAIRAAGFHEPFIVSAATGASCSNLTQRIGEILSTQVERDHESQVAIAGEHHDALHRALDALSRAGDMSQVSQKALDNADLVALELHAAADALGVLVGRDVPDDLLGRVFVRFCVGK